MPEFNRLANLLITTLFKNTLNYFQSLKVRAVLTVIVMTFVITPVTAQNSEQNPTPVNTQDKSCSLGVFPFISAQRLESVFAPIAFQLDEVMNCSLRYRSAVDFKAFMKKVKNREFDIAFIQPFDYVRIAALQGYIPLAARKGSLHAILVTRTDSEIRNLSDLKGKALALPPAVSAMAYLGREMLKNAGLDTAEDMTLLYSKNHGSCLHKVSIGKVAACITAPTTLRLYESKTHQKFKVVTRSSAIPNALFVARADIPQEKIHQLQQKILNLSLNESAQKLFNTNKLAHPFRVVNDYEYDIVRMISQRNPLIK